MLSTCTLFNDKKEQMMKAVLYMVDVRKIKKENTITLGLSFYLQKLYKINNVSYIVTLNNK